MYENETLKFKSRIGYSVIGYELDNSKYNEVDAGQIDPENTQNIFHLRMIWTEHWELTADYQFMWTIIGLCLNESKSENFDLAIQWFSQIFVRVFDAEIS